MESTKVYGDQYLTLTDRSSYSSVFETELTPSCEEYFYNSGMVCNNPIITETTASLYSTLNDDSNYSNCYTAAPFSDDDFELVEKIKNESVPQRLHICLYEKSQYFLNKNEVEMNIKEPIEEPQSLYCFGNNYYCGMTKSEPKKFINSQYQSNDLINYNLMKEGQENTYQLSGVESQYVLDK
uniref:Uncharacterized protein n=1 Tax=Strongyloides venezuelensis TaxID=75913 RepID=A0A0K0FID1_STRVS